MITKTATEGRGRTAARGAKPKSAANKEASPTADADKPHPASQMAHLLDATKAFPTTVAVEHFVDAMAQVQAEMVRFGAQRVHEAMVAQQEMLGCKTLGDLRHAQADYMGNLVRDYACEWIRLFGYGLRVSSGHSVPLAPGPEAERHATAV